MSEITKTRRQEIIFQLLKGRGLESGLSATEIFQLVRKEDIDIDLRTVRRDLVDLSRSHGLSSDGGRPEKFFPSKNYHLSYQLHLNENTLQVLLIALNNFKFTSHNYFKNLVTETETTLFNALDSKVAQSLRASKEKYFFDFSASGRPTSNDSNDFEKVMVAIRENKIITCNNNSPYKDKSYNRKKRHFAPYLFILTSGVPYIIVEDQDDNKFKKLKATRLSNVTLSSDSFTPIEFNDYLHLESLVGGWGGLDEEMVDINVICNEVMATYFQEKIVHASQKLKKITKSRYKLTFKCSLSAELVRLLASFGGGIESVGPRELFLEIKNIWKSGIKSSKLYNHGP